MRTFYVYNINDNISDMYDMYPYKLYKMLEDAYFTNKHNIMESATIYSQIIDNFNKLFLNNYLIVNNKLDVNYYNRNNLHTISNRREYTKLMVTSHCLKIKSNVNYPKFFDSINNFSNNIFICDFINKDYFWLYKVVKNKDNFIKQ